MISLAGIIAVYVLGCWASLPTVVQAHTHSNADGSTVSWYPHDCCDDGDCRPVANVVRAPHGLWMTTVDGLTVLVGPSNRRLPSRDLRWHVCINQDIEAVPDTIRCVFEPPDT
jgi:hypothetical protein